MGSVLVCCLCGCCWLGWRCRGDRRRDTKSLSTETHYQPSCAVVSQVMSFVSVHFFWLQVGGDVVIQSFGWSSSFPVPFLDGQAWMIGIPCEIWVDSLRTGGHDPSIIQEQNNMLAQSTPPKSVQQRMTVTNLRNVSYSLKKWLGQKIARTRTKRGAVMMLSTNKRIHRNKLSSEVRFRSVHPRTSAASREPSIFLHNSATHCPTELLISSESRCN